MAEKITIKQKFQATQAILKGEEPEFEFTVEDAIEFLQGRVDQLASKKPAVRKPDPEVEARKAAILEFLTEQAGQAFSAKELAGEVEFTQGQVQGALNGLVGKGKVLKCAGEKSKDPMVYFVEPTEE